MLRNVDAYGVRPGCDDRDATVSQSDPASILQGKLFIGLTARWKHFRQAVRRERMPRNVDEYADRGATVSRSDGCLYLSSNNLLIQEFILHQFLFKRSAKGIGKG